MRHAAALLSVRSSSTIAQSHNRTTAPPYLDHRDEARDARVVELLENVDLRVDVLQLSPAHALVDALDRVPFPIPKTCRWRWCGE